MAEPVEDGQNSNPNRNLMRIGVFKIVKIRTIKDFPENQHEEIRNGGKIILPESVLHKLNGGIVIPSPFILKIVSGKRHVMCGVISFSGQNGHASVPEWVMKQLHVTANTCVTLYVLLKSLAKGERVLVQPLSTKFLDITDPKAVLERSLRNFACLTKNDTLNISYNNLIHPVLISDTKPDHTINIIDCDLVVDFIAPPGYKEPTQPAKSDVRKDAKQTIVAFRADGKALTKEQKTNLRTIASLNEKKYDPKAPDFDFKVGSIRFFRKFQTNHDLTSASGPSDSPSLKPPKPSELPKTHESDPTQTNSERSANSPSNETNNNSPKRDEEMEEDPVADLNEDLPLTRTRARTHGIILPDLQSMSLGTENVLAITSGTPTTNNLRTNDKRSQPFTTPASTPKRKRRKKTPPSTI